MEDGQPVVVVVHHERKKISNVRMARGLAVPLSKDRRGHSDVSPQLLRGITAQEQAVKKGCLTLRKVESVHDFGGNELWHRGHRERCSLQKSVSASSRTAVSVPRSGELPLSAGFTS